MTPYADISARMISQSSHPNFTFDIFLAIQRVTTAMVASTVNTVMAAIISGPRLWLSHGTASLQMDRVVAMLSGKDNISRFYAKFRSKEVLIEQDACPYVGDV